MYRSAIAGRRIKQGAAVWTVGTWSLKAQLYAALRKQRQVEGADDEPPGACHFGMWLEENYFLQLVSEYLADEKFKGRLRRVWKERGANHFLDCRIYNNALAYYLGLNRMTPREWQSLARLRGVPDRPAAAPAVSSSAQPTPAPAPKRPEPAPPRASRSSFMDGF